MPHVNTHQNPQRHPPLRPRRPQQPLLAGIGSTPVPDTNELFEAFLALGDQGPLPINDPTRAASQFRLDRQKALRDEGRGNFQDPSRDLGQVQALLGTGQTGLGVGAIPPPPVQTDEEFIKEFLERTRVNKALENQALPGITNENVVPKKPATLNSRVNEIINNLLGRLQTDDPNSESIRNRILESLKTHPLDSTRTKGSRFEGVFGGQEPELGTQGVPVDKLGLPQVPPGQQIPQNGQALLGVQQQPEQEVVVKKPFGLEAFERFRPSFGSDENPDFSPLGRLKKPRKEILSPLTPGSLKTVPDIKGNIERLPTSGEEIPGDQRPLQGPQLPLSGFTETEAPAEAKPEQTQLEKLIESLSPAEETKFQRIIRALAAGSNQLVTGKVPKFLTRPQGGETRKDFRKELTSALLKNAIEQETRPFAAAGRQEAFENQALLGNLRQAQIDEIKSNIEFNERLLNRNKVTPRGGLRPAD